jgi:LPS export ABC transporter permease LptG
MKILFKYIFKQTLGPFFMGLSAFVVFISLQLLYQLAELIVRYKVGIDKMLILIYYNLPMFIVMGLPVGVLFAILWILSRMRSHNELIAFQTHGVTLRKLVIPFIIIGILLCFVAYFFNDYLVPVSNKLADEAMAKFIYNRPESVIKENTFIDDGSGKYLYIKRIDPETGTLYDVLFYDFSDGTKRVVSARRAENEKDSWYMYDGRIYEVDRDGFLILDHPFGELEFELSEDIQEYIRNTKSADEMTSAELRQRIKTYSEMGIDTSAYQVVLQEKYSQSIGPLVLVLLGVPLSLIAGFKSKSWSVILTFILIVFYQGSGAWLSAIGKESIINPNLAPWIPNIIFITIGLICYFIIDSKFSFRIATIINKLIKVSIILLIFLVVPTMLKAGNETDKLDIQGDTYGYINEEILFHNGVHVIITTDSSKTEIDADYATLLTDDGDPISMSFWGNVIMKSDSQYLEAERLVVNLENNLVSAVEVYGNTEQNIQTQDKKEEKKTKLYLKGDLSTTQLESPNQTILENGYITTCNQADPHYRFKVSEAVIVPDDYAEIKNLVVYIGKIPVLYLPYYKFSLVDPELRTFDFDWSNLTNSITTMTFRNFNLAWLTLEGIWQRDWSTADDYFSGSAILYNDYFNTTLFAEVGETEDEISDYGGYFGIKPKTSLNMNFRGIYYHNDPSEFITEPFKDYNLGSKKETEDNKTKTITLDPFDVKKTLNATDMLFFGLDISSPEDWNIELESQFSYADYFDEKLWTVNLSNLEFKNELDVVATPLLIDSNSFKMSLLAGKRMIEKKLLSQLHATLKTEDFKFEILSFKSSIKKLNLNFYSSAEEWKDIFDSENIKDTTFDVTKYNIDIGNFSTTGDLKISVNASPTGIIFSMPTTKKGKPLNIFSYKSSDEKFSVSGKYALNYNSEDESTDTKLFWIDPLKISYKGFIDIDSSNYFETRLNSEITWTSENSISKTFEIFSKDYDFISFKSSLIPEYEFDFKYDQATETSNKFDLIKNNVGVALDNNIALDLEYYYLSLGYIPKIYYNFIDRKIEWDHPGEFKTGIKTGYFDVDYEVDLDFETLVSSPSSFEWIKDGYLETNNEFELSSFIFELNSKSNLLPASFEATKTALTLKTDIGSFSHKTETNYIWEHKVFSNFVNVDKLNLEFSPFSLDLSVNWTLNSSTTEAEEKFDDISLTAKISYDDIFSISLKTKYPYVYKSKKFFERYKLEFGDFNLLKTINWKSAIIDFNTEFEKFSDSYPFPSKYFSTVEGYSNSKFFIIDITKLSIDNILFDNVFFATRKATESEQNGFSIGLTGLNLNGNKIVGGGTTKYEDYGFTFEYNNSEYDTYKIGINDLSLKPSLLKRMTVDYNTDGYFTLEIGSFSGLLNETSEEDWDNSLSKLKPLYFDLHCQAIEFYLKLKFGKDVKKFGEILNGIGIKYYIKAFSDRYLLLGLSEGKPFFQFKF